MAGSVYASGIASKIRKQLIKDFNLHTVVRLPKGVFEPYADIPTNILFFSTAKRQEDAVWFYEHPVPLHRAKLKTPCYSQTDPLQFEEFVPLIHWWGSRIENRHAWRVEIGQIEKEDWSLDQKNPRTEEHRKIQLVKTSNTIRDAGGTIDGVTSRLSHALQRIDDLIARGGSAIAIDGTLEDLCDIKKGAFPTMKTPPGDFPFVVLAADKRTADNYQFDGEAVCIPMVSSTGHGHAAIHRLHYASGQFAVANILAAVMVKPHVRLLTKYLFFYLWRFKEEKLVKLMAGTANTSLTIEKLNEVKVQAPVEAEQLEIVQAIETAFDELATVRQLLRSTGELLDDATTDVLRATFSK